MNVYTSYTDISGRTAFLIMTKIPRSIVQQGFITMRHALLSVLVSGIVVLIVMLLILEKTILAPLAALTEHVLNIRKTGNFSARLSMARDDEIGTLADAFDRMVEQIEQKTRALAVMNEELKKDIAKRLETEKALQEANKELQDLAHMDGLTRIANRRRFDEYLKQEWNRLARANSSLSLIICDVDYFKRYNDTYGHQLGDDCLRSVAEVIRRNAKRSSDLPARYGGEEFAIILPNTEPGGAFCLAESIRKDVENLRIIHARSFVSPYLTISMGVASLVPGHKFPSEMAVEFADKALYEAKDQGRNRTVLKTPGRH